MATLQAPLGDSPPTVPDTLQSTVAICNRQLRIPVGNLSGLGSVEKHGGWFFSCHAQQLGFTSTLIRFPAVRLQHGRCLTERRRPTLAKWLHTRYGGTESCSSTGACPPCRLTSTLGTIRNAHALLLRLSRQSSGATATGHNSSSASRPRRRFPPPNSISRMHKPAQSSQKGNLSAVTPAIT